MFILVWFSISYFQDLVCHLQHKGLNRENCFKDAKTKPRLTNLADELRIEIDCHAEGLTARNMENIPLHLAKIGELHP